MSYVIVEYDKLMGSGKAHTFYEQKLADLESRIRTKTEEQWSGLSYGAFTPAAQQYGRTTINPTLFVGFAGAVLTNYRQNFLAAGWQNIFNQVIPEDVRIAWAGLAFPSKCPECNELRWQIGDVLYARLNIEEMYGYNKPAILFEEGFIIPEETQFLLRGRFESAGFQRIVPLGFALYRRKDQWTVETNIHT